MTKTEPLSKRLTVWDWIQRLGPTFTLVSAACILFSGLAAWNSASIAAAAAESTRQSAEASLRSALISEANATATRDASRSTAYSLLKNRYYVVDQNLPREDRDRNFRPKMSSRVDEEYQQWRAIRSYWYHCFDEWFLSKQLSPDLLGDLWESYYLPAHLSALDKRSLRGVFLDMSSDKDREFGKGIRKTYADELRAKYKEKFGELKELEKLAP